MACQCDRIRNLQNDMDKLTEMIKIVTAARQKERGEIRTSLNRFAQTTRGMARPDNINDLMQHQRTLNRDSLREIEGMFTRCNQKRSNLSTRIRTLTNEDRRWHSEQRRER